MKIKMFVLGILLLLINWAWAWGGSMDTGGCEITTYQNNPWFLDRDEVTYCVQKSDNYSQSFEKALFEVKYAIEDWERTLAKIDKQAEDDDGHKLVKRFKYIDTCSVSVDLKILLGVMDDGVRGVINNSGNGFVAFAKRESFDNETMQSRGYIWIAPDIGSDSYKGVNKASWIHGQFTYYILLHELGHVMGFLHNENFVMLADMAEKVADRWINAQETFKKNEVTIYNLPSNLRFHLTKIFLLQSFVAHTEEACTSLPLQGVNDYERDDLDLINDFIKEFLGIAVGAGSTETMAKDITVCIRPQEMDRGRGSLIMTTYSAHPTQNGAVELSKIVLPWISGYSGEVVVTAKQKVDNIWETKDVLTKWYTEGAERYSATVNNKIYDYTVRSNDDGVFMSFVHKNKIVEIPFSFRFNKGLSFMVKVD